MTIAYQIENVTKTYKKSNVKANDALSFVIHEGEIFGLLGPNGAGKSTLVGQLAGLVRPTSGAISLFGQDVVRFPQIIAEYVALQQQSPSALLNLTAVEALQMTAQLRGCSSAVARQQASQMLEGFGLSGMEKRLMRKMSQGQMQLLNIALTLVGDRPVLIFDEPTNHLDPTVRQMIWERLFQLNRSGKTILLVTHNLLEAERVIQRLGLINHGHLLAIGTPGELKKRFEQQAQVEFQIKPGFPEATRWLQEEQNASQITPGRWRMPCTPITMQATMSRIIEQVGPAHLENMRFLTPSLEDVYLQLERGMPL